MNEQALKERIKYISHSEGRIFNQVWRNLILERLLDRLSHFSYNEQFIFKGGLLLSYYITLGRETKDADLVDCEMIHLAFFGIYKTKISAFLQFMKISLEKLKAIDVSPRKI